MSLAESFWLADPGQLGARLAALTAQSAFPVQTVRLGTSYRGRDLVAFQAGTGPLHSVLVAGLHAAEFGGPYGFLAFAQTLATGRSLDGEDLASWVAATLAAQTITIVPLLNIDGAIRMSGVLPGCWHPNLFNPAVDAAGFNAVSEFVRAPISYFGLTRGKDLYLTDEQVRVWTEEQGGTLGQLWSDQGVDLWEDWGNFRSPETRALRDLLDRRHPDCVLELHGHEIPTAMYVPIPAAQGVERRRQMEYGEAMMTALRQAGLPCTNHSARTYHHPDDLHQFPDVVYQRYGCLSLFGEINCGVIFDIGRERLRASPLGERDADARALTQDEIIRSVWLMAKTLVDLGGRRAYK